MGQLDRGDCHAAAVGDALDDQAGFAPADAEQPGLDLTGQGRLDHVAGLGQRRHLEQIVRGRDPREVLAEVVGRTGRVDGPLLALDGDAVFQMRDQAEEDRRAALEPQLGRLLGRGLAAGEGMDDGLVHPAAVDDFVVHIAHVQGAGDPVQLRDKAAHPLHALDQPFLHQLAQGAVHRHAADLKLRDQSAFARQQIAGHPVTAGNAFTQMVLDLEVLGLGAGGGTDDSGHELILVDLTCIDN
mmetsp:Transcript_59435/g.140540  ORF Transcript_59435/g.140540 Transcript_59435/m.140540 type:complete len:242 (+) Transcript_59435:1046-1771(+)